MAHMGRRFPYLNRSEGCVFPVIRPQIFEEVPTVPFCEGVVFQFKGWDCDLDTPP